MLDSESPLFFWFSLFPWPHNWKPYWKCELKSEWNTIFKVLRFVLCLNLLKIPIPRFTFTWTWAICLLHYRCSSRRIPRYLTVFTGVSLSPSSLNLTPLTMFVVFQWKIINSVILTFKETLLAINHWSERMCF